MDLKNISSALGVIHPICINRALNAEVWDIEGRQYIDFVGGIGVLNLGHGHPAIVEAAKKQIDRLVHSAFNAVPHQGYLDVAQALNQFVPVSYPLHCMLTNSGAEAVENALKIVRAATGRQAVIAFDDAFHGRTLAALNLNGKVSPYKNQMGPLPGPVYHLPFPSRNTQVNAGQALKALERLFEVEIPAEEVACIIVEPVQGEGGFKPLCPDFAATLRALCKEKGIVLVFDEIQCGFGRTGKRFAFSHLNVEPDMILLGKSMAAGFPLAAVAGKAELMNSLPRGGLGGTYSGNAVACSAALAVMEVMTSANLDHWGGRQENMILEAYEHWKTVEQFPMLGEMTGIGSMRGIVFNDTTNSSGSDHLKQLLQIARENGLLLMPSGRQRDTLRLLPPLTIEPDVLSEGLNRLGDALKQLRP